MRSLAQLSRHLLRSTAFTGALAVAVLLSPALSLLATAADDGKAPYPHQGLENANSTVYQFSAKTIDGKEVSLSEYKGKVLLIVNTASKCGFTGQYEGLQELYAKYKEQGLEVLAFPTNDFGGQEPGSNAEIQAFCKTTYNVTFPLFEKISVKGEQMHPLYKYLTTREHTKGPISWNFNKFLINRKGEVVDKYGSMTRPDSEKITEPLEKALGEK